MIGKPSQVATPHLEVGAVESEEKVTMSMSVFLSYYTVFFCKALTSAMLKMDLLNAVLFNLLYWYG